MIVTQVSVHVVQNGLRPEIPRKTPEPFARLMTKCWDTNPNLRPSFRAIIFELNQMKLPV